MQGIHDHRPMTLPSNCQENLEEFSMDHYHELQQVMTGRQCLQLLCHLHQISEIHHLEKLNHLQNVNQQVKI